MQSSVAAADAASSNQATADLGARIAPSVTLIREKIKAPGRGPRALLY